MSLRKFGSRLQGHPNPHVLRMLDVATGSLGQGLPIGVGMALNGKYLDKLPYRVYVVLGDSECAEGSIWEAFDKASYYKLNNLTAILDMNRLGQRGETDLGWDSAAYAARARAFGWNAVELDGHDLTAIDNAYATAEQEKNKPTVLVAKTVKGSGVALVANKDGWHGKALSPDQAEKAIAELGGERKMVIQSPKPAKEIADNPMTSSALEGPSYALGGKEATRKAYGDAITALGARRSDVVALDAEVSNSTYADEFKRAHPDRFFEMSIAEQQLLGAAVGLGVLGKKPFASTFAPLLYPRLRSNSDGVDLECDHSPQRLARRLQHRPGRPVADGAGRPRPDADRPGQHRPLPVRRQPDRGAGEQMADLPGISYIRTTREKTPILYGPGESFPVGGARLVKRGDQDRAAVIAAGITVHEAVKAYDKLWAEGIEIRIIDAYTVKPIDKTTLEETVKAVSGKLVTVEDHWPEGGLGDAVLEALAAQPLNNLRVVKLAVKDLPGLRHAGRVDARRRDRCGCNHQGGEIPSLAIGSATICPSPCGGGASASMPLGTRLVHELVTPGARSDAPRERGGASPGGPA